MLEMHLLRQRDLSHGTYLAQLKLFVLGVIAIKVSI